MGQRLRLLAVCYHFPPVGSAGTSRAVRLLPALADLGVDTTVLTVDPATFVPDRFTLDESHMGRVASLEIIRIDDAGRRYRFQKRWPSLHKYAWFAAYPLLLDYASAWSNRISRNSDELAHRSAPDAVYVSAPPFSAISAARDLASSADAPLIVDFRDPWTTASLYAHPSRLHFLWERQKELKLLGGASRIILNTLEAKDLLTELEPSLAERSVVIPNALLPGGLRPMAQSPSDSEGFELLFTGTLFEDRIVSSRRGQYHPDDIDEGARSLRPLLAAMQQLKKHSPEALNRLRVVVAGFVPSSQRAAIDESGMSENFKLLGSVTHAESLDLVFRAGALYLNQVAWANPDKPMPHVPGKTFEYIASGRPILAPLGPGATRRVLGNEPNAIVCSLDDAASISESLKALVESQKDADPTESARDEPADHGATELDVVIRTAVEHPRARTRRWPAISRIVRRISRPK